MDLSWLSPSLNQSPYAAAWLIGLLGGVHCLGMCGGIVSALGFSQKQPGAHSPSRFPILLAYNIGRISSYTLAGALAGGLGAAAFSLSGLQQAQSVLYLLAATFMIILGLYLAGLWRGAAYLERAGTGLWHYLEPFSRRFIPVNTPLQAFPFGMVWGWLPCGLVYSVLIWSLSAGSALKGGLLMLAFGLGTLPNLLLMGAAANRLTRWTRQPKVRLVAGLVVVILGLGMVWRWWDGL